MTFFFIFLLIFLFFLILCKIYIRIFRKCGALFWGGQSWTLWHWERNNDNNIAITIVIIIVLLAVEYVRRVLNPCINVNALWFFLKQAVCCSDHTHCCPNGYTCDVVKQQCTRGNGDVIEWFTKTKAIPENHVRLLQTFEVDLFKFLNFWSVW